MWQQQDQPDFILALSFRLAFYIAPTLTKGDPFKIKTEMFQAFQNELGRARSSAFNEEQLEEEPEAETIRGR